MEATFEKETAKRTYSNREAVTDTRQMLYARCVVHFFSPVYKRADGRAEEGKEEEKGRGSRDGKVAQFRDAQTITGIENIEAKATANKSWQHVSPVDFTGRRTAFYFCFAPIIDEL